MSNKIIIIQSETVGTGDDQLGKLLMASFLRQLSECDDRPKSIIFWNAGVKLACHGSGIITPLKKLDEAGVEILSCTTCLEYFGLINDIVVGKPTTMAKSVTLMLNNDVVCL